MEENAAGSTEGTTAFVREMGSMVNNHDLNEIKRLQMQMLGRLQDSNAVLSYFNDFSARSFSVVASDFGKNTKILRGMRGDLDYIFKKIRVLRERIAKSYPNAFDEDVIGHIEDTRPDLDLPK
ncbi:hypothetical protein CBR_g52649 [Chara braunii]|uniref:KxDL domain-containing protein n=1 Tax=Chara braunii TaxID=69332 RepID=A0A388MAS6_CHABU|nr:hypothetical protein CBR_g52649 [Chara braunii]|eukprot:GBG91615.1 hypothetical protein CBR_g52649 [Chara braunii]